MTQSIRNIFAVVLTTSLLFVSCLNTIKRGGSGETVQGATTGSEGSAQGVNPLGVPDQTLPPRSNQNPEATDDSTLAVYTVYFDYDSFSIAPNERGKLENVAQWLADNPGDQVFVKGHTDERGTTEYNLGLSQRRALAARSYLIGLGVAPERVHTIAYGEERPAVEGNNEAAWSKNRRAQFGLIR